MQARALTDISRLSGGFSYQDYDAEYDKTYTVEFENKGVPVIRLTGVPGKMIQAGIRCDVVDGEIKTRTLKKHEV